MKITILRISVFVLLLGLVGTGCEKEEDLSYLDNSAPLATFSGFGIYKTRKDYFFNVAITPLPGQIYSPEIKEGSSMITLYKGKYYYTSRYRLCDDFIVSVDIGPTSYFTSLTYDQYIREKLAPVTGEINQKLISNITDRDPFTEYYQSPNLINGKSWITVDEINQIIKEKNLEKYFIKVK